MPLRDQLENLPENILEQFCCAATGLVCLCIGFPVPIILMYRFVLLIINEEEHYRTWNLTVTSYNFTCPIVTYLDGEDRPCCACDREEYAMLYFGHCCDRDSAPSTCLASSCSAVNPSKGLHFFLVVVMITILLLCIACFAWMCDKTVQTAVQMYNAHMAMNDPLTVNGIELAGNRLSTSNSLAVHSNNNNGGILDSTSIISRLTPLQGGTNRDQRQPFAHAPEHEDNVGQGPIFDNDNGITIQLPVHATISMENVKFVPHAVAKLHQKREQDEKMKAANEANGHLNEVFHEQRRPNLGNEAQNTDINDYHMNEQSENVNTNAQNKYDENGSKDLTLNNIDSENKTLNQPISKQQISVEPISAAQIQSITPSLKPSLVNHRERAVDLEYEDTSQNRKNIGIIGEENGNEFLNDDLDATVTETSKNDGLNNNEIVLNSTGMFEYEQHFELNL